MVESESTASDTDQTIDLKDPAFASFLAWLWPGAGHLYQGRWAKGMMFMVCVLTTFFYGLFLGEGRVVYASWRKADRRLPYLCQIGVGLPATPALIQAYRASHDQPAWWSGFMAPPKLHPNEVLGPDDPAPQTLSELTKRLNRRFELGTLYTMIAGLLNVLVIWDAWGGPVGSDDTSRERPPPKKSRRKRSNREAPAPESG